jgi:hypothetical protein
MSVVVVEMGKSLKTKSGKEKNRWDEVVMQE